MGSAEFGIIALNPSASNPKTAWEGGPRVGHTMPVFLEVSEQVLGRVFMASKHPASEPDSQSLCDSQGTTSILGPRAGPRPTRAPRPHGEGLVAVSLGAGTTGLPHRGRPQPCLQGPLYSQLPAQASSLALCSWDHLNARPSLPSFLTNPVSLCRQLSCPTAALPSTAPGEPGGGPHSC